MTRQEAFDEINKTQEYYVNKLVDLIHSSDYDAMKTIYFTSPTGTGKTKMMGMLINRFPKYYFIVTTLSKGQLHLQIRIALKEDCLHDNYTVYGCADYKINSKLEAQDIIGKIPADTKCIWLRDEGHIKTNRFEELLVNVCYKVVNFSATNQHSDITCNFTHTMMLRTVNQSQGSPEDAIKKLIEVKKAHKDVPNYNPCAIFRCIKGDNKLYDSIVFLCEKYSLKHIDLNDDPYTMMELCEDDNEYDVIINKFKIVEGIDIRRAHVLYMDNQPGNNATTIQVIGRCRRNALLYSKDIDILAPENEKLLNQTRECYVFYNQSMKIDQDETGELQYAFCNYISCEELKAGTTIEVKNGQLRNGLYVLELDGETGVFDIVKDKDTKFNVVSPETNFYKKEVIETNNYLYFGPSSTAKLRKSDRTFKKININNVERLPLNNSVDQNDSYLLDFNNDLFENVTNTEKDELLYIVRKDIKKWNVFLMSWWTWLYLTNEEARNNMWGGNVPTIVMPIDALCELKKESESSKSVITYNDRESAIIGTDFMKQYKHYETNKYIWIESKTVTAKIKNFSKLNAFVARKYADEINTVKPLLFHGQNDFSTDSKQNSMLGYCVEYYSKYLIYGYDYLKEEMKYEMDFLCLKRPNIYLIIKGCLVKYKKEMLLTYGIPSIKEASYKYLCEHPEYVQLIVDLGTKTAEYVKKTLYPNIKPLNNIDPNLSIKHISGLADYITEDTILDIKVLNHIDETCIRQVLAYHYLSTKRSDLHIKRVIVYDATSGRDVVVNISEKNLSL